MSPPERAAVAAQDHWLPNDFTIGPVNFAKPLGAPRLPAWQRVIVVGAGTANKKPKRIHKRAASLAVLETDEQTMCTNTDQELAAEQHGARKRARIESWVPAIRPHNSLAQGHGDAVEVAAAHLRKARETATVSRLKQQAEEVDDTPVHFNSCACGLPSKRRSDRLPVGQTAPALPGLERSPRFEPDTPAKSMALARPSHSPTEVHVALPKRFSLTIAPYGTKDKVAAASPFSMSPTTPDRLGKSESEASLTQATSNAASPTAHTTLAAPDKMIKAVEFDMSINLDIFGNTTFAPAPVPTSSTEAPIMATWSHFGPVVETPATYLPVVETPRLAEASARLSPVADSAALASPRAPIETAGQTESAVEHLFPINKVAQSVPSIDKADTASSSLAPHQTEPFKEPEAVPSPSSPTQEMVQPPCDDCGLPETVCPNVPDSPTAQPETNDGWQAHCPDGLSTIWEEMEIEKDGIVPATPMTPANPWVTVDSSHEQRYAAAQKRQCNHESAAQTLSALSANPVQQHVDKQDEDVAVAEHTDDDEAIPDQVDKSDDGDDVTGLGRHNETAAHSTEMHDVDDLRRFVIRHEAGKEAAAARSAAQPGSWFAHPPRTGATSRLSDRSENLPPGGVGAEAKTSSNCDGNKKLGSVSPTNVGPVLVERDVNSPSPTKKHKLEKPEETGPPRKKVRKTRSKVPGKRFNAEVETLVQEANVNSYAFDAAPMSEATMAALQQQTAARRSTRSSRTSSRIPLGHSAPSADTSVEATSVTTQLPGMLDLSRVDGKTTVTADSEPRHHPRTEKDLAAVTRTNTRRNKAASMVPKAVIQKQRDDVEGTWILRELSKAPFGECSGGRVISRHYEGREPLRTGMRGSVKWAAPLVRYQGDDDAEPPPREDTTVPIEAPPVTVVEPKKKATRAGATTQAARRSMRVSKLTSPEPVNAATVPTTATSAAETRRASQVATSKAKTGLGMTDNGTPVPKRRSRGGGTPDAL